MTADFKLSDHFSFHELTFTTHEELQEENRKAVSSEELTSLRDLCQTILEPIRAMFGMPLIIHSGYRCEALNTKVGGVPSSQHRKGEATDFHVRGLDDAPGIAHVFERVRRSSIPFGQVIDEFDSQRRWLHISLGYPYRPPMASGLALRMRIGMDGKKTYEPVI